MIDYTQPLATRGGLEAEIVSITSVRAPQDNPLCIRARVILPDVERSSCPIHAYYENGQIYARMEDARDLVPSAFDQHPIQQEGKAEVVVVMFEYDNRTGSFSREDRMNGSLVYKVFTATETESATHVALKAISDAAQKHYGTFTIVHRQMIDLAKLA